MSCFSGGLDGSYAWLLTSLQVSASALPVLSTHLSTPCSPSLKLVTVVLCRLLLGSKLMMPICGLPSKPVLLIQAADVLICA